jgi:hypothetical protein
MHKFCGNMTQNVLNPIRYPKGLKRTREGNIMRKHIMYHKKKGTYIRLEKELSELIKNIDKEGNKSADKS